jgi:hypothetical protein
LYNQPTFTDSSRRSRSLTLFEDVKTLACLARTHDRRGSESRPDHPTRRRRSKIKAVGVHFAAAGLIGDAGCFAIRDAASRRAQRVPRAHVGWLPSTPDVFAAGALPVAAVLGVVASCMYGANRMAQTRSTTTKSGWGLKRLPRVWIRAVNRSLNLRRRVHHSAAVNLLRRRRSRHAADRRYRPG